jgi:hypothetical protein
MREHYRGTDAVSAAGVLAADLDAVLDKILNDNAKLSSDPLYLSLAEFAAALSVAAADTSGNENTVAALLDKAFSKAADAVGVALSTQYANKTAGLRVLTKLPEIFGIPASELPPLLIEALPTLTNGGTGSGDEKDENEEGGGYGGGNELFGSNDTIYHPFGENGAGYVPYGEAYAYYYEAIEELLLSGTLDEATQKKIIDYFARLSNGTK